MASTNFTAASTQANRSLLSAENLIEQSNENLDRSAIEVSKNNPVSAKKFYNAGVSQLNQAAIDNNRAGTEIEVMRVTAQGTGQVQLTEQYANRYNQNLEQIARTREKANAIPLQQDRVEEQRLATTSSGQIYIEENGADSETAEILTADGRITDLPETTGITNAEPSVTPLALDLGTNAEVRPLIQTQSASIGNNEQGQALLLDPALDGRDGDVKVSPGGSPGVGSATDDAGSKNLTRTEIDNVFSEAKIVPQPNVLDRYASYTYSASLYLMNAQDYQQMMRTKQKNLLGAQLLIQSGGAPVQGRNQFFSNDYYIDKITLHSAITGKGTNAAHNVNNVKMTVVEPNGITLIGNLDRAVQAYLGSAENKKKNFAAQMYLLVIRFYGYDKDGNLITYNTQTPQQGSDRNAFIEKWYPLTIGDIKFKVANKLVEYEISGTSPSYAINAGTNRGTIPYNVELGAVTVKDALSGPAQYTVNGQAVDAAGVFANTTIDNNGIVNDDEGNPLPTPPKASAAPTPKATVRQGLMAALNQYQQQLVKEGLYTYPDVYSIEFVNASIEDAKIKNKGSTDKTKVANNTSKNAAQQKDGRTQSADTNSKILTITAGSQIVQVIDQIVRNSSYLEDQQIVIFDPNTQKERPNGTAGKNLAYFKIGLEATPTRYDPKRNDYAYNIKYVINVYRINESASNYFYVPTFKGVHKQYNYWFTGENTSVLSYEQDYNAMYTSVLSGGSSSPATVINDAIKFNFAPRSAMSSQGADGKVNEPKANLADYLFNPGDLANCTMTIVGDPAWLQQGEAFAGIRKTDPFYFRAFLADGTINFESQQILFEVLINAPKDYDLSTGLIDPNQQTTYFLNGRQPGAARQSYVYRANECVSEFNKGKFTQTLKGTLQTYYPDQTFKANQEISQNLQNQVLNSLSDFSRQSISGVFGSLSTPGFGANFPTVGALTTQATGFGINAFSGRINGITGGILGSAPTRPSTVPGDPTSFGISIGTPGLNSSTLSTPPFVGSSTAATTQGTTQFLSAGDDAGTVRPSAENQANNNLGDFNG